MSSDLDRMEQLWAGADDDYVDRKHRQDCNLRYMTAEEAAAKDYGCTCEREAAIQARREAGDPVWN